jgi:hypothetical protein
MSEVRAEMLAIICRTARKNELEIIAFYDNNRPMGFRRITKVTLEETMIVSRRIKMLENVELAAWFNQFDATIPAGQQALVALLDAESFSLRDHFEVEPLGHAAMTYDTGKPIHLPTATLSTKKKLCAQHWDQLRGLVRQWQQHHIDENEQRDADTNATSEAA